MILIFSKAKISNEKISLLDRGDIHQAVQLRINNSKLLSTNDLVRLLKNAQRTLSEWFVYFCAVIWMPRL